MKVLITAINSYVGKSVGKYLSDKDYEISYISLQDGTWKDIDMSVYDCVFHVAGLSHEIFKKSVKEQYLNVNYNLTKEIANKAKDLGVKQFIFMSSSKIYSDKGKIIDEHSTPAPNSIYGYSKKLADEYVLSLDSDSFHTAVVRAPMIYGPNCKGNFARLVNIAKKIPIFPKIKNKRSMLYIDNLCEFIKLLIDSGEGGVFFPQNYDYVSSYEIVKAVSEKYGKKIWITVIFNWAIFLLMPFSNTLKKAFGSFIYDKNLSKSFDEKYILEKDNEISFINSMDK